MSKKFINGYDVTHIDTKTGEILMQTHQCTCIMDSTKTKKQLEAEEYKQTHMMDFNVDESFVKLYDDVIYKIRNKLTLLEYKLISILPHFIEYETCALVIGIGTNKHYMALKEISQIMDIKYSATAKLVKGLIQKGIIAQITTENPQTSQKIKYYVVNPYLYINGKNPEKAIVRLFASHSDWQRLIGD